MTIGCNIWMICLKLNWFFYSLSRMFKFSQFVWSLRSLVWDVFNNFLLIDATDRSKISSDQKRFFVALSLYPFHFSRTLPLNSHNLKKSCLKIISICESINIYISKVINYYQPRIFKSISSFSAFIFLFTNFLKEHKCLKIFH